MTKRVRLSVSLAFLLVLSACGTSGQAISTADDPASQAREDSYPAGVMPGADQLGDCPEGADAIGDVPLTAFDFLLESDNSWSVFSAPEVGVVERDSQADQLTLIVEEPPGAAAVAPGDQPLNIGSRIVRVPSAAEPVLESGGSLLIGTTDSEIGRYTKSAILIDSEGRFAVDGLCSIASTLAMAEYLAPRVAEGGPTAGELVVEIATNPTSSLRKGLLDEQVRLQAERDAVPTTTIPTWESLSPDERQLVPGETPPEIFAGLVPVEIRVEIPEAWRSDNRNLCTRTQVAWGACIRMSLIIEPASQNYVPVTVWVAPGQDLEVWLMDEKARLAAPVDRVFVIPAADIDRLMGDIDRASEVLRLQPSPRVRIASPDAAADLPDVDTFSVLVEARE